MCDSIVELVNGLPVHVAEGSTVKVDIGCGRACFGWGWNL
jgi:hypothetical protein